MTGTEKQIKWAEDIKFNAYSKINSNIDYCEKMKSYSVDKTAFDKEYAMWNMAKDFLNKLFEALGDNAAIIIDKRYNIEIAVKKLLECKKTQTYQDIDVAYEQMKTLCGNK